MCSKTSLHMNLDPGIERRYRISQIVHIGFKDFLLPGWWRYWSLATTWSFSAIGRAKSTNLRSPFGAATICRNKHEQMLQKGPKIHISCDLVGPRQISLIRESNSWRKEKVSENPSDLGIVARLSILRKKKLKNISALVDGPVVHTLLNLRKLIVHRRNGSCLHLWWSDDINNLIFFSKTCHKKSLEKKIWTLQSSSLRRKKQKNPNSWEKFNFRIC